MATRTYSVPGISCDHCKHSIEAEVGKLAGVVAVNVDIDTKSVFVDGEVSDEAIRAAIDEAGFDTATLVG